MSVIVMIAISEGWQGMEHNLSGYILQSQEDNQERCMLEFKMMHLNPYTWTLMHQASAFELNHCRYGEAWIVGMMIVTDNANLYPIAFASKSLVHVKWPYRNIEVPTLLFWQGSMHDHWPQAISGNNLQGSHTVPAFTVHHAAYSLV